MAKGKEIWVCPRCGAQVDISSLGLYAEVKCSACGQEGRVHVQLGNFRLEGVLGVGGMSVVYRALDVTLRRPVALKVLNDTFRDRPERVKRFENESAMMARVRHDNVASVYSAGRAYGQFYIAMELVEGENLEYMVSEEKPLEAEYALELVRQAALGLRAASEAGLLHRDMKPGNILITRDNRVKLIDFGLALDDSAGDTEEVIWATPYYVPPETLQRNPEDVRTDIYALGMTLRYLLSGVEQFDGEKDSVTGLLRCKQSRKNFAKQRPELNPLLCDLADHMTEFLPSKRPKNYDELLEEIEEVERGLSEKVGGKTKSRTRRALEWAAVLAVIACLGYGLLSFVSRHFGPSSESMRHRHVAVEKVDVTPTGLRRLRNELQLLDAEKYDEAFKRLMALSKGMERTDPCVALLGAYLARTVSELTVLKDHQAWKKAQQRMDELRDGKETVPLEEKSFMEELSTHLSGFDLSATDWYNGSGDQARMTQAQLKEKIGAITNGRSKAPLAFRTLQRLAESSLLGHNEDLVDLCLDELEDVAADAGIYQPLGKLYNRVMDERLSVRRVAMYEGIRARALGKIDQQGATKEEVNALAEVAKNEKLPHQLRDLASVESEAATLAMHMQDMLIRKFPETCKKGMSLKRMFYDRYRGPTVICRSEQQQNLAIYAVDGNLSTRWCAKDRDMGEDVLRVKLPEPRSISSVVFYWEDAGRQTYRIKAFYRGKEVSSTEVDKNTNSSRVQFAGKTVDELTLSLASTDWGWPSVREIEFYDDKGEHLYIQSNVPQAIAHSEGDQNPAAYALDGDLSTRWCATHQDMADPVLLVKLPEPKGISFVAFYWENNGRQTYRIKAFCKGEEVSSTEVDKNTDSSRVLLTGKDVDEVTLSMTSTDWMWPSVREIEFYGDKGERFYAPGVVSVSGVPPEMIEDMGVVVDMLVGEEKPLQNLHRVAAAAKRGVSNLNTIAASWSRRLDAAEKSAPEGPLAGKRDRALGELMDRVNRCRLVRVKGPLGVGFLNSPYMSPGLLTLADEQQTVFLLQVEAVELLSDKIVPVYGLKRERVDSYTLTEGQLQPVPLSTAKQFEANGSGVIIKTLDDLLARLKDPKQNPTSFLLQRVPVYNFPKK